MSNRVDPCLVGIDQTTIEALAADAIKAMAAEGKSSASTKKRKLRKTFTQAMKERRAWLRSVE